MQPENNNLQDETVSIEILAAKDANGLVTGLFLGAPPHCGLKEANILRINGKHVFAMKDDNILPIDLPEIPESYMDELKMMQRRGKDLPVSELLAGGLFDAYMLKLVIS